MTDMNKAEREERREDVGGDTGTGTIELASSHARRSEAARESAQGPGPAPALANPSSDELAAPLFSANETARMRSRWESIQTGFVDEPKNAVKKADELVAEAIKHLTEGFAAARQSLEQQWARGNDVSTEDLRLSVRRYRTFFERLLSI